MLNFQFKSSIKKNKNLLINTLKMAFPKLKLMIRKMSILKNYFMFN